MPRKTVFWAFNFFLLLRLGQKCPSKIFKVSFAIILYVQFLSDDEMLVHNSRLNISVYMDGNIPNLTNKPVSSDTARTMRVFIHKLSDRGD